MDLLEGGIRVPYIVRWPGNRVAAQLAITMDWVATFLMPPTSPRIRTTRLMAAAFSSLSRTASCSGA